MQIKKKLNKSNILYIIFFSFVLFINVFFLTPLKANTFKISDLEIVRNLCSDFNSVDRDKIIQRTSHGVSIMKSIVDEMGINAKLNIKNNESIIFTLEFQKRFSE